MLASKFSVPLYQVARKCKCTCKRVAHAQLLLLPSSGLGYGASCGAGVQNGESFTLAEGTCLQASCACATLSSPLLQVGLWAPCDGVQKWESFTLAGRTLQRQKKPPGAILAAFLIRLDNYDASTKKLTSRPLGSLAPMSLLLASSIATPWCCRRLLS